MKLDYEMRDILFIGKTETEREKQMKRSDIGV
jgi:hypothetical protein